MLTIKPTRLINVDDEQNEDNATFATKDLVYILSLEEYKATTPFVRSITKLTDYAILNGASSYLEGGTVFPFSNQYCTQLRTYSFVNQPLYFDITDTIQGCNVDKTMFTTIRPRLHFDIQSFISEMSNLTLVPHYVSFTDKSEQYYKFQYGSFPNDFVGKQNQILLNNDLDMGLLQPTGKSYTGYYNPTTGKFAENLEYINPVTQEKFVLVKTKNKYETGTSLSDGTSAFATSYEFDDKLFLKIKPISWIILNWRDLPKEINPDGNGYAEYVEVISEEGIISGFPFHYNDGENSQFWQNSTIRSYLNGINVNNIISNGNPLHSAPHMDMFVGKGFLQEAFDMQKENIQQNQIENTTTNNQPIRSESNNNPKPKKGYGIQIQETPMSIDEQIRFYIDNKKSFMLHGPSGIGKTRRIEEIDPDFVSIVLRNGILPEEVIGKNIYPNNDTTTSGTWVPPAWYTLLCEKCKNEPDKNHILFIDEITNVKPYEQSLVYNLVLTNSIGPNYGKLPENVVVVAAGNSKEESSSAYNMPEPLFRRFEGHITLKKDIQSFLEWGSENSNRGEDRLKIHPIISRFIASYGDNVFYSKYDSEEPPKFAIDPRGWEQVSDIIYDNDGIIVQELISNKIGPAITANFIAFAKNPPLSLEDICDMNYDETDIPTRFNEQYALALSLRGATIEQIPIVYEFIANNLGNEILSMFSSIWVGNNNERAILIDNLNKNHTPNLNNQDTSTNSDNQDESTQYPLTGEDFDKMVRKHFGLPINKSNNDIDYLSLNKQ